MCFSCGVISRDTFLHLVTGVSQAEFRGWVQSLSASRMESGFSFWTLKEGPVGERNQMG